jgi:hypothetical protein
VLINQSGVLVNTLTNLIRQVAGGPLEQQTGLAYFTVDPSATTKGKNPQEDTLLPKVPPPIPTAQQQARGEWATIHSSSSDEWFPSSTFYATSGEVSASTSRARGTLAFSADITCLGVLAGSGWSSVWRRAGCSS